MWALLKYTPHQKKRWHVHIVVRIDTKHGQLCTIKAISNLEKKLALIWKRIKLRNVISEIYINKQTNGSLVLIDINKSPNVRENYSNFFWVIFQTLDKCPLYSGWPWDIYIHNKSWIPNICANACGKISRGR